MTITADTTPNPRDTTDQDCWAALHCFLEGPTEHVDAFLRDVVGPLLTGLRDDAALTDWFFIRYAEGGPHLRVRMRGASQATVDVVAAALATSIRASGSAHGEVRHPAYEPETERYGGPAAIAVAEDIFCRSTDLALAILTSVPDRVKRLTTVLDLWAATAAALDLDDLRTIRWLRGSAVIWRWHDVDGLLPSGQIHRAAHAVDHAAIARRWATVATAVRTGSADPTMTPPGFTEVLRWAELVRSGRHRIENDPRNTAVPHERWLGVWSSQLHMLFNRIGIVPDEERVTATLAANVLESPDRAGTFFDDDVHAADRRYLTGSRYVGPWMDRQTPRATCRPRRLANPFPPLGPATPLPRPTEPTATLVRALATRASVRGDLGGRLTADDIAGLVHLAAGSSARPAPHDLGGPPRRPYPSAGAKYATRLRLAARAVDGVPAGLYDVDEDAAGLPVLHRVGPVPTTDDLVASSMWFTHGAVDPADVDRIDAATVPAVLSVHIRLDVLRDAYGQRALRFAFLEAGHLAQNVVLAAAAAGLATTTVGGFYDDPAHEVFMLDGVDDVLAYLLPIGRVR